ncbi:MAG: DUF861 domain-containing protein [Gammaproteobacteria bacterium]|nr:DUF861 domain-containing protein [Gammaproteobacteria bacterium]
MTKTIAHVKHFADLTFNPRFEYGEQAQAAVICNAEDGTELGAGIGRLKNACFPWTIKYDEVLVVLEGQLRIHANGEVLQADKHDSIFLPAGTALEYEAEDALILYAIHPANWSEQG